LDEHGEVVENAGTGMLESVAPSLREDQAQGWGSPQFSMSAIEIYRQTGSALLPLS
jgi:hypothetical protein